MPKWVKKTWWLRWPLAIAILVFGVIGGLRHWFATCEQQADSGMVLDTCRDPSVTDAAVVFAGVLFLLLIAPDFDEAGLFGFALKRRVQQQEARQSQLENQLTIVSSRLEAVATAAATANATFNLQLSADLLRETRAHVDRKKPEFLRLVTESQGAAQDATDGAADQYVVGHSEEGDAGETGTPTVSDVEAELRTELLSITEKLERLMLRGTYAGYDVRDLNWALAQDQLKNRFRTLFAEELEVVQAARNAVVHAQPLEQSVLAEALDVARELLRIAQKVVS